MSKKTREEKRAEERRILAEMEAAIQENEEGASSSAEREEGTGAPQKTSATPKKGKGYRCPRCKTLLQEDGKCPNCGYKMYVPMDEKKRNKIRLILTVVLMVIFVALFVILQFRK